MRMTTAVTTQLTRTVAVAIRKINLGGIAPCLGVVSRRTLRVLYTLISEREKTPRAFGVASTSRRTLQKYLQNQTGRVVALTICEIYEK